MDDDNVEIIPPSRSPLPHAFKAGEPPPEGAGRKPGSRNKTTRVLKEAILLAAELEGRDGQGTDGLLGYLRRIAAEDFRVFAMLLGRVLPLQVENKTDMRVEVTYQTVEEVRRELEERGISIDAVKRVLYQPSEKIDKVP